MRRIACFYLVGLAAILSVHGGEQQWQLSLGGTYRQYAPIELHASKLRNHDRMMTPGGPFGIQGYTVLPGLADGSGVTADQVRFRGDSDTVGWEFAPTIGLERELWYSGNLSLGLCLSLSYVSIDGDMGGSGRSGGPGRFDAAHFNYLVFDGNVLAPPLNDTPLSGFSPGTSATLRLNDFELDLWTLDVGVRGRLRFDRLYLMAATGPVLYLADAESSVMESGSWNPIPGTGDTGRYKHGGSTTDFSTEFGVFGSIGIGVDLTERIAAEAELRWDEAFGTIGTNQASMGLDGVSGIVRLVLGF